MVCGGLGCFIGPLTNLKPGKHFLTKSGDHAQVASRSFFKT